VIRVLLVDDQPLVRGGFAAILRYEQDIDVVGQADDGRAGVELARSLRPDVVLMDIRMPAVSGLEATQRICSDPALSGVKVVILTTFEMDEYVFEALRSGASGFLLKSCTPDDLVDAVRIAASGDAILSPSVTRRLIAEYAQRSRRPHPVQKHYDELTGREREVVTLVAQGLTNEDIAARLYLSVATVRTHISRAMTKLRVGHRAQLVIFAYETGLVTAGWTSGRQ
jgi:DNA-binding NarL/FixJ family response regulator